MKCPETDRVVPTVLRMTKPNFEALTGEHAFRCPSCGHIHRWNKQDAWVEESAPRLG